MQYTIALDSPVGNYYGKEQTNRNRSINSSHFLGSMVPLVCLRQSTCGSFMGWLDAPSFVSGLNAWIVVFGVENEEYLEAVDLTSYVGTIPTWLASYFLV